MDKPIGQAVSRWPKVKSGAKAGLGVTGLAISGAQTGLNVGTIALATGAAAASATGIGLVVTGSIATLTTAVVSAKSALSTSRIVETLERIEARKNTYCCNPCQGFEASGDFSAVGAHGVVRDQVLPYILAQKEEKTKRKIVGAVPVVNATGTAYSAGRWLYKRFVKGNLGEERNTMAGLLAAHLVTRNCALAQAIVSALYSFEEMIWMLEQDEKDVAPLLAKKMKSI